MKFLTFLEKGEERSGIQTTRPGSGAQIIIDISLAVSLLRSERSRLWWITGWRGPWGGWTAPESVIDIARYGKTAVVALEELEKIFWQYARSADGLKAEGALRNPAAITWLPPIPEPPAVFFFHNNSTTCLQVQFKGMGRRQVFHTRTRPLTSLVGHHDFIPTDEEGFVKTDLELGFVSGPPAHAVPEEKIMDHVFGYTICTDGAQNLYRKKHLERSETHRMDHKRAVAGCGKAMDACGAFGPVIVTADELGDPTDLKGAISVNDIPRAHMGTSGYLDTVPEIMEYFSRIMTVQPGTIFAMGAAGFDGFPMVAELRQPGRTIVQLELDRIGKLENTLAYPDEPEGKALSGKSPYAWRRNKLRLQPDRLAGLEPGDIPGKTRQLWATTFNHGNNPEDKIPAPYLYPRSSLHPAFNPIRLPKPCRTARISVQLAVVVGPDIIYRADRAEVSGALLGHAILVGVQDLGVADGFPKDPTEASTMFAYHMACFGDGYHRMGSVAPSDAAGDLFEGEIALEIDGIGRAEAQVSDYACDPADIVEWITMGITLLPADIVSLGASKAVLDVPLSEGARTERKLKAIIGNLAPIETVLVDERDPNYSEWGGLRI